MFQTGAKMMSFDGVMSYPRATDGLSFSYSSMADDSSLVKSSREASMLFAVAEGHLKDGMTTECLQSAEKALALFKASGDDVGAADTLGIIISALCLTSPEAASAKANAELAAFTGRDCKRGVACMQLALAEISASTAGGALELDDAFSSASEALSTFEELGDSKMEASAQLVRGSINAAKLKADAVLISAGMAMSKFKETGDFAGQAKALHLTAMASVVKQEFLTAIKMSTKAKANYLDLGDKRSAAAECEFMSRCFLAGSMPHKALVVGREAMALRDGLGGKMGAYKSLFLIVSALIEGGRVPAALKAAQEGVKTFTASGDKKALAMAYESLMYAEIANGNVTSGLATGEKGCDIAATDLNDSALEMKILKSMSQALIKAGEADEAMLILDSLATKAKKVSTAKEADALVASGYIKAAECATSADDAKIDEVVDLAQTAGKQYKEAGSKAGQANALVLEAKVKSTKPENESTVVTSLLQEARALYQEVDDMDGEAEVMNLLADSYMYPEGYSEATTCAQAAADLLGSLGKKAAQAEALYKVANISVIQGDGEDAMDTILEAQELAQEVGAKAVEAKLLTLLSQAYVNDMAEYRISSDDLPEDFVEMRAKAMKAVKEAYALAGQSGDPAQSATALYWNAQVLLASFRGFEAVDVAGEAEAMFAKIEDAKGQVNAMLLSANVNKYIGNKVAAKVKADAALALAESDDWAEGIEAAKEMLNSMKEKKVKGAKKPKKGRKGKKTKMVKKLVKKGGSNGGGLDLAVSQNKIVDLVKQVLVDDETPEIDQPFMEAGIDSLGSVQLVTDISKEFRMALAPSVVFDYPTVKALAGHLVEEAGGAGGGGEGEWVEEWVEEEVDGSDDEDESDDDDDEEFEKPVKSKAIEAASAAPAATVAVGLDPKVTRNKIADLVRNVLTDDEDSLSFDTPLMEAGIDSLGSVQLVTDVSKEFKMALAPSVVFDFPTVNAMADHLVAESAV